MPAEPILSATVIVVVAVLLIVAYLLSDTASSMGDKGPYEAGVPAGVFVVLYFLVGGYVENVFLTVALAIGGGFVAMLVTSALLDTS